MRRFTIFLSYFRPFAFSRCRIGLKTMMMHDYPLFSAAPAPHRPLSVWELSLQVKDLVEAAFPEVWVAGEISNFVRPQSGHCYLTLKDQRAQLRAVVWRGAAARLRLTPQDGLEVVCRGISISIRPAATTSW